MKTQEEKAKQYAKKWNEELPLFELESFTIQELSDFAKYMELPYYIAVPSILKTYKEMYIIFDRAVKRKYKGTVASYRLSGSPIHYSVFMEVFKKVKVQHVDANDTSNLFQTCNVCGTEKPATKDFFHADKAKRYGLHYTCIECKNNRNKTKIIGNVLSRFTDEQIVKELRDRGFEVKAIKTITLDL